MAFELEDKEIAFWNRYGFNPSKISDVYTDTKKRLTYDEYSEKYNKLSTYFNERGGMYTLKREDDEWEDGDLVLFRNNGVYSLGNFNGKCIKWLKKEI